MKKLLALVLALVMTLSLAVVGSNAAFKDADKVNETYAEAVDVLAGMKVFQGYTDGSFQPEGSITRAEVAAIVYRLYTADVADKQASLYATYNKFTDMNGAAWAAGYIGYCANAGLIKGYDAKTFGPADKVTGYQALAMILRAVGYDKNDEFTGAQWQLRVASTAQQLGILKNVKGVDLNAAASRELVAELLFRTAAEVPMVTYTPALGYTNLTAILNGKANATLGEKNFGLTKSADTTDKWGRPCYKWTNGKTGSALVTYATVKATPVATYTKAVTECDVAHDAGLKVDTAYTVYVNGSLLNTGKYTINLTDTVTKIGAQGRLVEVYDDTIVMIDTFLAKVNSVADAAYDAQGHLSKEATINLTVYDDASATANYILFNGKTNYEYAVGDYVLLNAFTPKTSNTVLDSQKVEKIGYTNNGVYGEIVGKATSVEGAQSIIYWNSKQHNVAGTVYNDALKFKLDQAGTSLGNYTWFFDQYGNLIGDVEIAAATSYGVINSIWWAGNAADGTGVAKANVTYMDGTTGQVDISKMTYNDVATLTAAPTVAYTYTAKTGTPFHYTGAADGKLMTVDKITGLTKDYFFVDDTAITNKVNDKQQIVDGHLFQFTTQSNGTVAAVEVSGNKTLGYEKFASTYSAVSKDTLYAVATNNSTLFLVRSKNVDGTYKYEAITGINNIGNYAPAEVDYVDLNGDRVADYVFVIGESVAAKAEGLFYYAGNNNYSYDATTGYWTIGGFMDGVDATIKVKNPNFFNGVGGYDAAALAEVNALVATGHALYYVKTDDGVYVPGSKFAYTANESTTNFADPRTDVYNNRTDVKVRIHSGKVSDSFVPGLLRMDSYDYIINANTKFVVNGVKADTLPTNISDYNVITVLNTAEVPTKGLALQVYAVSKNIVPTTPVAVTGVAVTVSATNGAHATDVANAATAAVTTYAPTGTTETATLKVTSIKFYVRGADGNYTTELTGDFVTGGYYYYVATVEFNNADADGNGVNCVMSDTVKTVSGYFNI